MRTPVCVGVARKINATSHGTWARLGLGLGLGLGVGLGLGLVLGLGLGLSRTAPR